MASDRSIDLDGVNDFVTMGDVLDKERTDPFTAVVWVRRQDSPPVTEYLISKYVSAGIGWGMLWTTADELRFFLWNNPLGDYIGTDGPAAEQGAGGGFSMYSAVNAGTGIGGMEVFVNGEKPAQSVIQNDLGANTTLNTNPFQLGAASGASLLDGRVHEAALFNRALPQAVLRKIYNWGIPNFTDGKGVAFDGVDEHAVGSDLNDKVATSVFSITVKFATTDTDGWLFFKADNALVRGYGVYIDASGRALLLLGHRATQAVEVYTNAAVNDGEVHEAVFTLSGSGTAAGVTAYIDGAVAATTTQRDDLAGGFVSNNGPAVLGGRTTTEYLTCTIHRCAVHGLELSGAQVTTIYNDGFFNDLTQVGIGSLENYWRCGDGANDAFPDIRDYGSVGNDLTMTNQEAGDIVDVYIPGLEWYLPITSADTFPTLTDVVGGNDGTMTNMDAGDIVADTPTTQSYVVVSEGGGELLPALPLAPLATPAGPFDDRGQALGRTLTDMVRVDSSDPNDALALLGLETSVVYNGVQRAPFDTELGVGVVPLPAEYDAMGGLEFIQGGPPPNRIELAIPPENLSIGGGGPAPDVTAPTVVGNPTSGTAISKSQAAIEVDITDLESGVASVTIVANYLGTQGVWSEVVWADGTPGGPPFDTTVSSVVIANGVRIAGIRRNGSGLPNAPSGGWLWPDDTLELDVIATDNAGNVAKVTLTYPVTVSAPDKSHPTVDLHSPAKGGNVAINGSLFFRCFESGSVNSLLPADQPNIYAALPDGTIETVYTGGAFGANYSASSTRAGSFNEEFTLVRTGGWPKPAVTIITEADDKRQRQAMANIPAIRVDKYPVNVTDPVPVIGAFTPSAPGPIDKDQAIDFDVTDDSALQHVVIHAVYGSGAAEVIFDGTSFLPPYDTNSVQSGISGGFNFSLRRDGGWRDASTTISVTALDDGGGETTVTTAYTVSNPSGALDTVPPVIDNFDPPQGTAIDPAQGISFDVTDNSGNFRRIVVHAVFDDGVEEVVHDGDSFRGFYQVGNSRVFIAGGYRYNLLRAGGWPGNPTIRAFAIDASGNEDTA